MRLLHGLTIVVLVPFLFAGLIYCGGGGGGGDSAATYYADADGDGYGDVNDSQVLDAPQAGWVLDSTDCDDGEAVINPGAPEVCDDWVDDDCNDLLDCYDDAACAGTAVCAGCLDADSDGYYAVTLDCSGGNDCDDSDETVNPGVDADGDTINACQDCDDADSSTGTGTAEVCNGLDDDCDWQIDEDDPGGGVACDGADSDLCLEGTTSCVGGVIECSDNTTSNIDVCDGADNDCDSSSADGSEDPLIGAVCDTGQQGVCAQGEYTACSSAALVCTQTVFSSSETCNGLDDDCDGETDEESPGTPLNQACYTGIPSTRGVGECSDGSQVCSSGSWGSCAGQVLPTTEVCDGADNDCDGVTDESFPENGQPCTVPGQLGVCSQSIYSACTSGTLVCPQVVFQSPETCNGLDDDCDGTEDDGNPGGGMSCDGSDSDLCPEGTTSCVGGAIECSDNSSSTFDVCNGSDDDCDPSSPDGSEDPLLGAGCDGGDSDLCLEGTYTGCSAGSLVCSDNTTGILDLCNGLDDDCDPASADGSEDPQVGVVCDGPDSDLCNEGTTSCVGGAIECSDNSSSTLDICDGADNDCDSSSADGSEDPLIGAVCDTGLFGVCAAGTQNCLSGSLQCEQDVLSSPEVCNGLDDNCDGTPDEGDLCGGYVCQSGTCLSSCSSDLDCTSNYWCDGSSTCQPPKNQGVSCAGDNECITGNCVDGVCCDSSCGGTCQSCAIAGNVGLCSNIVAGTDPEDDCSGADVCDGAGGCITPIGGACSINAQCVSGFCRDGFCCSTSCDGTCQSCGISGSEGNCTSYPFGQDPENECTDPATCNGAGACT